MFKIGDRVRHKNGDPHCNIEKGMTGTVTYFCEKNSYAVDGKLYPPADRISLLFDDSPAMEWNGWAVDYELLPEEIK